MKTKLAFVGLMILSMAGCSENATHQNANAVAAPTPNPPPEISIISDPPGTRIEINNNYVGDAPLVVVSPFHWLPGGWEHYPVIITATPIENGYVQRKYFGPFDDAPSRVLFQTNLQPITNSRPQ